MNFINFLKRYLVYLIAIAYGFLANTTSSEFWSITISKTWLIFFNVEPSLLQKPIFSFFLSTFHFLPLNSYFHILLVKFVFATIGAVSIWFFIKLISTVAARKLSYFEESILAIILLCLSPIFAGNFFRIRSDQLTFLFFTLLLYFSHKKKFKNSIIFFVLISLTAVKNIIFIVPCLIIFVDDFNLLKRRYSKLTLMNISLFLIAALFWLYIINQDALYYLIQTHKSINFPTDHLKIYLKSEFLLILPSIILSIYILALKKYREFKRYSLLNLYFFIAILIMPQSFSFYIASINLFVYLPLILFIIKIKWPKYILISYLMIQLTITFWSKQNIIYNYSTHLNQTKFISLISQFAEKYDMTYLDGMGLLPRNNFIACFVSPDDTFSNQHCISKLTDSTPDIIIVTSRLFYLGESIFKIIELNYDQLGPNIWVKKTKITPDVKESAKIFETNLIPMILF